MSDANPNPRPRRTRKVPLNLNPVLAVGDLDGGPDGTPELIDVQQAPESEMPDYASIRVEPTKRRIVEPPEKSVRKETPRTGPPSVDEWQDFIGRIVLRTVTDAFLSLALRDIGDELTPRERASIELTKEDLKEMSAPLASLAQKSSFAKKRGRALIAASDSFEAVFALLIWMRRVNKISRKYRVEKRNNPTVVPGHVEESFYGNAGQNAGQGQERPFPNAGVFNPGTG